jgi:hypothetical protein
MFSMHSSALPQLLGDDGSSATLRVCIQAAVITHFPTMKNMKLITDATETSDGERWREVVKVLATLDSGLALALAALRF